MAQSALSRWLFGRDYQPSQNWDPYAQDRQVRMDALKGAMANYDQMMASPQGFIPQSQRDYMQNDVENSVRNQYAGQGQSGFVNDRLARARNDLNIKLNQQNLDQANKQRDYIDKLTTMNQPTQMTAAVPEQVGALGQIGGQMFSQAANAFGNKAGGMAVDALFGKDGEDENYGGR